MPDVKATLEVVVPDDWIDIVTRCNDHFGTGYVGYWLAGVDRSDALGWLAWEHNDESVHTADHLEAERAWRAGEKLPEGYFRLDADFAARSHVEGVRHSGEKWWENGDACTVDFVYQQTLLGKQVYG